MSNALEVVKVGMSGVLASWEVVNPDGSIADACYVPRHNLILDTGLDMVGGYDSIPACFAYLALGTGTSASIVGMTKLETETTYSPNTRPAASGYPAYNATTIPAADADPFIVVYQIGIQTDVGKLNGTFTELGFGPTNVNGANLFSRFRVVDSGGNPTSFTVASDQQLRLKYQLNIRFLPIVPTAYECAITGYDDTFGYTAGWQSITTTEIGYILQLFGTSSGLYARPGAVGNWPYSSAISTSITFSPLTTRRLSLTEYAGGTNLSSRDAYVPGSYANYINTIYSTLAAVGDIYGVQVNYYPYVLWLCKFDTPITKPDTHNLTFKLKFSWGRDT
jgi:hypothetical protein